MRAFPNGDVTPLVSFITPTIGRRSLKHTVESVLRQNDTDWEHVIETDDGYGSAGLTRNAAIAKATGEWLAFVDDDDTVDPYYVDCVRDFAGENTDVIVFRMLYRNGWVLPHLERPVIEWSHVGISFAMRAEWHSHYRNPRRDLMPGSPQVEFVAEDRANPGRHGNEDICLLKDLEEAGANIVIPPLRPLYYVNSKPDIERSLACGS